MKTPRYGQQVQHDTRTDLIERIPDAPRQRWQSICRDTQQVTRLDGPVMGWGAYNALYKVLGQDEVLRTYLVQEVDEA